MKKTTLLSTVFAIALLPAAGIAADNKRSFNDDARVCDSWTWIDHEQKASNNKSVGTSKNSERIAFGDSAYSIGW